MASNVPVYPRTRPVSGGGVDSGAGRHHHAPRTATACGCREEKVLLAARGCNPTTWPSTGAGGSRVSAEEPVDELDRGRRKSRRSDLGGRGGQADALTRELAELRKAHSRLRRRLDRLEADKARTAQSLDEMSRRLRRVTHEREEANAARDRIAAELEAMQRDRGEVVAERDALRRERDQMARELEAARGAHDEVLQESGAARAARDRAVSVRWVRWR